MKTLAALAAVLLVAALTGCSPDSIATGPSDTPPAGIPGPSLPAGEWPVDRLVYDGGTGRVYHVSGMISYLYAEDGAGFEFRTDVKLTVALLHTPEPGGGYVIDLTSDKGSVAKSGKVSIFKSYPLPGLDPSASLRLQYEVGAEGCTLSGLTLVFRPIEEL